jgi:ribonuclease E
LAFTEKVKIIKSYVPKKINNYIQENLSEELNYFQKKYLFKIEILSDERLLIPEYKIELLNKSKKIINIIENINAIAENKKIKKKLINEKKITKKDKKEVKKKKTKKKLRTLWTRRKKKN